MDAAMRAKFRLDDGSEVEVEGDAAEVGALLKTIRNGHASTQTPRGKAQRSLAERLEPTPTDDGGEETSGRIPEHDIPEWGPTPPPPRKIADWMRSKPAYRHTQEELLKELAGGHHIPTRVKTPRGTMSNRVYGRWLRRAFIARKLIEETYHVKFSKDETEGRSPVWSVQQSK